MAILSGAYSTVNTAGSVAFQLNSGTGHYAVSVNGGNPIAITYGGNQIHEGIFDGWTTLAAAEIDGVNTVLWKNKDCQSPAHLVSRQQFNHVSGQGWVDPNSDAAVAFETNFNLDLNGDGSIGSTYSTVNTAGGVAFQKKSGTGHYAVSVNGGNPIAITYGGKQIYEGIYDGWETLAAAEIDGVNTVLWKNKAANRLHILVDLDSNWNHVSGQTMGRSQFRRCSCL